MTDRERLFAEHRPLLFTVAYEMLGSAADAEDVVQETFLAGLARSRPTATRSPTPGRISCRSPPGWR